MRTLRNAQSVKIKTDYTAEDREKLLMEIYKNKTICDMMKERKILLYLKDKGGNILNEPIGYVRDITGKMLAKVMGASKIFFYADLYLTTNNMQLLSDIEKCSRPSYNAYRLTFYNSNVKDDINMLKYGMIIEIGV